MDLVSEIGGLNFKGNVVDHEWFNYITFSNGKPHIVAIIILGEIVYWYRPTVIRDEETGQIIYKKKFKADRLQKSYQQFADTFGFSKVQIKRACDLLVEMRLIDIEFRTVVVNDIKLNNVMFIAPNTEEIKRISTMYQKYEEEHPPNSEVNKGVTSKSGGSLHRSKEAPNVKVGKVVTLKSGTSQLQSKEAPNFKVKTNTEITTEITTSNNNHHDDKDESKSHVLVDDEFKISYKFLEDEGIPLSEIAINELGEFCNLFGSKLIKHAANKAIDANAPRWNYIKTVLENWQKQKVKTIDDVTALDRRFGMNKGKRSNKLGANNSKRTELVPDWLREDDDTAPTDDKPAVEDERKRLEAVLQKYGRK
ncbi:DnaD domain-containing protein [Bacillus cereus]|uniref:Primosomal replication protein N n=1 Tax=Bacillus cereus TaxID=1396 RepID=A0A9X7G9U1_BACCE|nr:DnaD domain protein [Bacillus cereus]PED41949.1 primosomal replication protein N [Bacillus cereus]PFV11235.1 primosomal replication protein N [Bacillus cereus]